MFVDGDMISSFASSISSIYNSSEASETGFGGLFSFNISSNLKSKIKLAFLKKSLIQA